MSAALETERLSRRFGRTEAVVDLSLEVPAGSIYAFLGPNGAGKTTTIKVLMNLLEPTSGRAAVMGVDSKNLKAAELARIGYVSENQKLPEWMTIEQLIAFCKPFYSSWDEELCSKLLEMFDLPARQKIRSLSRGMKMKAAMITALAHRPRLLMLDEPFSGLDPLVRDEMIAGMLELAGEGDWTIFVSSHDLSEVENLVDHVAFLRQGRLVVAEELSSLQQRFREVEVTLPEPAPLPPKWPGHWLVPKQFESVIRFVDSDYSQQQTPQTLREVFPENARFAVSPVSLREVFVTLARAGKQNGRQA